MIHSLKPVAYLFLILLFVPCTVHGQFAEPKSSWGETVRGAKAGLASITTARVGQPFEVVLNAVPPAVKDAYVEVSWGEEGSTKLELTDGVGRSVPFRIDFSSYDHYLFFGANSTSRFRLWPTETHAHGRYWKPGEYRLRATIESKQDLYRPGRWHGKLVTNMLVVTIAPADTPVKSPLADPAIRKQTAQWVAELDSEDIGQRDAAEKALKDAGVWVLPVLEKAMSKASLEATRRIKGIQQELIRFDAAGLPSQITGGYLASLDVATGQSLQKLFDNRTKTWLRVQAARHAPILTLPEKEIVALLDHKAPDQRIRAIRSLPRTGDKAVHKKLVNLLEDRYTEILATPCMPSGYSPVAYEARDAIIYQGREIIPILLDHAEAEMRKKPRYDGVHRPGILDMLGKLGPGENSQRFIERLLQVEDNPFCEDAINAFVAWGRAGIPLLVKIASNEKEQEWYRQRAMIALSEHDKAKELGPFFRRMIHHKAKDCDLSGIAIIGITRLKLRDTLPELKRIALAEIDTANRFVAVLGVIAMAERAEIEMVLVSLLDAKRNSYVRIFAMEHSARADVRTAVPLLLAALDEQAPKKGEYDVRVAADLALRVLANLPNGVGYDPTRRNSEVWRAWWASKKP